MEWNYILFYELFKGNMSVIVVLPAVRLDVCLFVSLMFCHHEQITRCATALGKISHLLFVRTPFEMVEVSSKGIHVWVSDLICILVQRTRIWPSPMCTFALPYTSSGLACISFGPI